MQIVDRLFGLLSMYMWEEPLVSGRNLENRNLDKAPASLKKVRACFRSFVITRGCSLQLFLIFYSIILTDMFLWLPRYSRHGCTHSFVVFCLYFRRAAQRTSAFPSAISPSTLTSFSAVLWRAGTSSHMVPEAKVTASPPPPSPPAASPGRYDYTRVTSLSVGLTLLRNFCVYSIVIAV